MESCGPNIIYTEKGHTEQQQGDPTAFLKEKLRRYRVKKDPGLPNFQGGWFGFFSYEYARHFETIEVKESDLKIPEACFYLIDEFVILDPEAQSMTIVVAAPHQGQAESHYQESCARIAKLRQQITSYREPETQRLSPSEAGEIASNYQPAVYQEKVRTIKEYIRAGDIFQANFSQRLQTQCSLTPSELYRRLQKINPSPYGGLFLHPDFALVSSSPERLIRLAENQVDTRPIAGTRPRGADADADERLGQELILNEKERAEHIMLVDLERNDIGRVCKYGSVHVNELMVLEKYSHVIHIVSNVRGELLDDQDGFDLIKATFPGGTITGTPKIRCMEILHEMENVARGPYTGSLGYLSYTGDLDLNIIIRTIILKDGTAYLQVGGGIVADSNPQAEFQETYYKAQAMLEALL